MMDKIRAFEMWCYRRLLKIRWTDRVSNEEVLRRMNVTPMLLTIIAKSRVMATPLTRMGNKKHI